MMKVSDPIIFGHVVKAYFADVFAKYGDKIAEAGLTPERRPRRDPRRPAVGRGRRRDRRGDHGRPRARTPPVVRQLRQGHHEPARPLRRDRRCLDAGAHPQRRQAVGRRRRRGRHPRRHPRLVVRERLPDGHRRRDRPRPARPGHDRLGAQRRPHGAGGRGVRQPRQDVRDRGRRRRAGRQRRRRRAARARRAAGRHLARDADQGHRDPRLGEARRHARPRHRRARRVLARRDPLARRGADREGEGPTSPSTTPTASRSRSSRPRRRRSTRSTASARARTPSR